MTAFEYISKFVNCKLQPSKIHGVGVFAMTDIDEGQRLFVPWNHSSGIYSITEEQLNTFDDTLKYHLLDMGSLDNIDNKTNLVFYLNNGCHWIFKTPLHWVNSCAYNEIPNIDGSNLLTLKKIKKGEELLSKYGKFENHIFDRII